MSSTKKLETAIDRMLRRYRKYYRDWLSARRSTLSKDSDHAKGDAE